MASPLGADDAQGVSSFPCIGCEGKNWRHGQAMGRATINNKNTWDAKRPERQALKAPR
jgi:hypothetical protein